jgi:hypothetical protein
VYKQANFKESKRQREGKQRKEQANQKQEKKSTIDRRGEKELQIQSNQQSTIKSPEKKLGNLKNGLFLYQSGNFQFAVPAAVICGLVVALVGWRTLFLVLPYSGDRPRYLAYFFFSTIKVFDLATP